MQGWMRYRVAALFLAAVATGQDGADIDALFEQGRAAFFKGRQADAEAAFRKALAAADAAGKPQRAVQMAEWIASTYLQRRDFKHSLDAYRDVRRRLVALYGEKTDRVDIARNLHDISVSLLSLERREEALDHARRARAMEKRLGSVPTPSAMATVANLANVLTSLKRWEEARQAHEEALALARSVKDPRQRDGYLVKVANNYALFLRTAGDLWAALTQFEFSLRLMRRLAPRGHPNIAMAQIGRAQTLSMIGRHAEAVAEAEAGIAMFERFWPQGHLLLARGLGNFAGILLSAQRPAEALLVCRRWGPMLDRFEPGSVLERSSLLRRTAEALRQLDRVSEAPPLIREAIELKRRAFGELAVGGDLHALGMALWDAGEDEQAAKILGQALELTARIHNGDHYNLATAHAALAKALRMLGRGEAAAHLEKALAMYSRIFPEGHRLVAESASDYALLLESRGDHERAREYHKRAVEVAEKLQIPGAFRYRTLYARNLMQARRPRAAAEQLEEAIAGLEAMRRRALALSDQERSRYFGSLRGVDPYALMVFAQLVMKRPDRALEFAEQGRARTLLDMLERARGDLLDQAKRGADAEVIAAIEALQNEIKEADKDVGSLEYAQRRKRGDAAALRSKLVAARGRQLRAARERAKMVAEHVEGARPATATQIASLPRTDRELLLYYVVAPRSAHLLVVAKGEKYWHDPLVWPDGSRVTGKNLQQTVDDWRAAIARAGAAARGMRPAAGARRTGGDEATIAQRLFAALVPKRHRERLLGARRVYVVPHGPLHRLPFEALRVDAIQVWNEAGPPVSYGASGTALLWSRRRRAAGEAGGVALTTVLLGAPEFGGQAASKSSAMLLDRHREALQPLPGTRREVVSIYRTLTGKEYDPKTAAVPGIRVLLGKEATAGALFDAAPGARILHLATHYFADETEDTSLSCLALSIPKKPREGDDGFLRLSDLLERWRGRLSGCELVVLSACETQRGARQRDEAVFAIPVGFLYAGASSVLASLWRVDDESTADLMAEFYRRVKAGEPMLEAFVAARRKLRKARPEPYFWAPFVFLGDPR